MAKYEQENQLVQLFADLKGTFKQLEGVTDLKKQDSLLQSTSAKLQEAKLCAPDLSLTAQPSSGVCCCLLLCAQQVQSG